MKKKLITNLFVLSFIMFTFSMINIQTAKADEVTPLGKTEQKKLELTLPNFFVPVWSSSDNSIVKCGNTNYKINTGKEWNYTYTCDVTGISEGTAVVSVGQAGITYKQFTVTVSKYNKVICVNQSFDLSFSSKSDLQYSFASSDNSPIQSKLSGVSSITLGSYQQYCKTYSLSMIEPGEHHITVTSSLGNTLSYFVNVINHSYDDGVISQYPTCTEDGIKLFTCKYCHASYSEKIDKLGHDFAPEWTIDRQPTCTEEGLKSRHCTRCGETTDQIVIPKIDHVESDWIIDQKPTCEVSGKKHIECTVCNMIIKSEDIPATGHFFSDWSTSTKPTALIDGIEQRTCSKCGKIEQRNIPKLKAFVKLNKTKLTIKKNKSTVIKIKSKTYGDSILNWKSSNKNIVSVTKSGKITALKKGKAYVTITMKSKCTSKCLIIVK